MYTLVFPYSRPPLAANQRYQWYVRARLTKQVRGDALDRAEHIPHLGKCSVLLTWHVTDRRRRDVDNIVPTLKAMCDGLVDAGVVEDDTPEFMQKLMPAIELIPKEFGPAYMTLRVEKL